MSRLHYYAALTFLVTCLFALIGPIVARANPGIEDSPKPQAPDSIAPAPPVSEARVWFQASKQQCNRVELEMLLRNNPAPEGMDRAGFTAACIGLSGQILRARDTVLALPAADRAHAAGIVYEVAAPIAAVDDSSASEMMALVAEFAPDHHMAFYYAALGAHRFRLDPVTRTYLERFLDVYQPRDRFRLNAEAILRSLDAVDPAGIPH